jgi:hypothetical protein
LVEMMEYLSPGPKVVRPVWVSKGYRSHIQEEARMDYQTRERL